MDDINKIIDSAEKLPLNEIYNDLFQPSFKKAGIALETLVEFSSIPTLPIKLLNAKTRHYFKKNLEKYEKKLQSQIEETIEVPQYIGLPILEKFTYLNDDVLSEAFINLLTKASFKSSLGLAHPLFISILNNLSSDEAKILFFLKDNDTIPFIDLIVVRKPPFPEEYKFLSDEKKQLTYQMLDSIESFLRVEKATFLTGVEYEVKLDFPENIDVYIENLIFNGILVAKKELQLIIDEDKYIKLEEEYYKNQLLEQIEVVQELSEKMKEFQFDSEVERGYFKFSEIGNLFIKACIKEK